MSISPKLSNSAPGSAANEAWRVRHEHSRHVPEVIERLIDTYDYQMKFVVASRDDCLEAEAYLRQFPRIEGDHVWMMPLGMETNELREIGEWLQPLCEQRRWRYCPRMQIEWFGSGRMT